MLTLLHARVWGAVLFCISLSAWSLAIKSSTDNPRLPMKQTTLTVALSVVILYVFPAVSVLLLTYTG